MEKEIVLTDANFEKEVLQSNIPVLVDFWATWCGPCRMMGPILTELAQTYAGKIKIGKINTEENATIAGQYGIISIPTFIFFKGGKPVDQIIGAVSKNVIAKKMDRIL